MASFPCTSPCNRAGKGSFPLPAAQPVRHFSGIFHLHRPAHEKETPFSVFRRKRANTSRYHLFFNCRRICTAGPVLLCPVTGAAPGSSTFLSNGEDSLENHLPAVQNQSSKIRLRSYLPPMLPWTAFQPVNRPLCMCLLAYSSSSQPVTLCAANAKVSCRSL